MNLGPLGSGPVLSVLVPVYNEAATVESVLGRLLAVPISKELIVIDDGSTDCAGDVLDAIEGSWTRRDTHLTVVRQPRNLGKGAALRAGIGLARGRVTAVQDADLEYDPMELPRLVEPVVSGRADAVYGSRWLEAPREVRVGWHALGNRLLTAMSNGLTGLRLTDMETCYKVVRTDLLQSLQLREYRFGIEPELTAHLAKLPARILEMPISYTPRSRDQGKKIGWRDALEAAVVMVRCWRSE